MDRTRLHAASLAVLRRRLQKQAAQADAPNYRAFDKQSGKACATCQFLDPENGFCIPFNFKVNPDYVCDIYAPNNGVGVSREAFKK